MWILQLAAHVQRLTIALKARHIHLAVLPALTAITLGWQTVRHAWLATSVQVCSNMLPIRIFYSLYQKDNIGNQFYL